MQIPDYLAIGHVCHDWNTDGNLLGGTVSYASIFAKKMGLKSAVLTSCGEDFEFKSTFEDIILEVIPSKGTTYFKNMYQGNDRQQYLLNKATDIFPHHIPEIWKKSKMVHLGLIANEIDFSVVNVFPDSLVALSPQGWMRRWDTDGKVFHEIITDWGKLTKAKIVILSEEDLGDRIDLIPQIADTFSILVVTHAEQGAEVFFQNKKYHYPVFQAQVVDPTGAGDVFAAAFLIQYHKTRDIHLSTVFANAAASFCIEKKGIEGLATQAMIEQRINESI